MSYEKWGAVGSVIHMKLDMEQSMDDLFFMVQHQEQDLGINTTGGVGQWDKAFDTLTMNRVVLKTKGVVRTRNNKFLPYGGSKRRA